MAVKKKEKKTDINKEAGNLRDQLARALADYDNLRKRVDKERESLVKVSSQIIIIKLLPVLDTLEVAQVHLKDHGIAIALNQFKEVLKEEGLEEVRPVAGDEFNHQVHEAIETIPSSNPEKDKGKVAETTFTGWKFRDGTVVRYAKVKVYGDDY